jgi:hypothetical protein
MAMRLSVLCTGHPLQTRRFLVHISAEVGVDFKVILRLEGFRQVEKPIISSGVEPSIFRLVAYDTASYLPLGDNFVNFFYFLNALLCRTLEDENCGFLVPDMTVSCQ